jgi:hypothetical protein
MLGGIQNPGVLIMLLGTLLVQLSFFAKRRTRAHGSLAFLCAGMLIG